MFTVHRNGRKTRRASGVDLISDVLPFGPAVWYDAPDHAIGYAMHSSRSHDAVICVYDEAGNVDRLCRERELSVTFSVLPDVKRFLGPSVEQLLLKTVCTTLAA